MNVLTINWNAISAIANFTVALATFGAVIVALRNSKPLIDVFIGESEENYNFFIVNKGITNVSIIGLAIIKNSPFWKRYWFKWFKSNGVLPYYFEAIDNQIMPSNQIKVTLKKDDLDKRLKTFKIDKNKEVNLKVVFVEANRKQRRKSFKHKINHL